MWPSLLDIRTRVRLELNEPVAAKYSDAELNRIINDGQRAVAIMTGCFEVVEIVYTKANSRIVPFAGHKVTAVEYIPVSGRIGLQAITPKHLGHMTPDGITPQFWLQWGDNIIIEPVPTIVYTLYAYISRWPYYEMHDDTDEPLIPTEFHPVLPNYTLAWASLKKKRYGSFGYYYKQFITETQDLAVAYVRRMKDTYTELQIPDSVQKVEGK